MAYFTIEIYSRHFFFYHIHSFVVIFPFLKKSCRSWSQNVLSWRALFLKISTGSTNKKRFTAEPFLSAWKFTHNQIRLSTIPISKLSNWGYADLVIKNGNCFVENSMEVVLLNLYFNHSKRGHWIRTHEDVDAGMNVYSYTWLYNKE